MESLENADYKAISDLVEKNMHKLTKNKEYTEKYIELSQKIEEFNGTLNEEQKEDFEEIMKLNHEIEKYNVVLGYYLGKE